jgi:hypothetical protein
MGEMLQSAYKRLFEVRILHHYWLDNGNQVFDDMPPADRNKLLLTYSNQRMFSVIPTPGTQSALDGLQCVFRQTSLGFVVAAPADRIIPDDAVFTFIVAPVSSEVFEYTALSLLPRKIYEIYYAPEDKIYRYKENVPVLSNLTGVKRGTGQNKVLTLSTEYVPVHATDTVEALVRSGTNLKQLLSDPPGALMQVLNADFQTGPLFVHQADAPLITPPAGLTGHPRRGIALSGEIPDQVFAVIVITAVKAGDTEYSCTTNHKPKANGPVFQVKLKNRSTFRKYIHKQTGATVFVENDALPMTYTGNAGTRQKPTTGGTKKIPLQAGDPATLVSEIYA